MLSPVGPPGRNAARAARVDTLVKKIGFLSFGHWSSSPGSKTRSASDALLQSIDLAVAAEELGADGAYFRVHHFARQLGSPFPLLAAAMRHWQDADATHLSVNTMGAGLKTVDDHLAALATAAEAAKTISG